MEPNNANGAGASSATATPTLTTLADFAEAARLTMAEEHPRALRQAQGEPSTAAAKAPEIPAVKTGQESPPENRTDGTKGTDANATAVVPTPEVVQQGLATLQLNATQTQTITKALTDGSEIDAAALGLSAEQTTGLNAWLDKTFTPTTTAPTEAAEPTTEEQAQWTDSEKRIYGALQKERDESKTARAKSRELETKLQELQTQLTQLTDPAKAKPATGAPATDPNVQTPNAPSAVGGLADCETFAEVNAVVQHAASTEATVMSLQGKLYRGGLEQVAPALAAIGVTHIRGTPVAEADANLVGDFLDYALQGTKETQAAAASRKEFITAKEHSWRLAAAKLPAIDDIQSPAHKGIAQLIQRYPQLRQLPNAPEVAVKLYLGEQAFNQANQAKPATTTFKRPTLKAAPGAPRRATAAMPQAGAGDVLAEKIRNGTATLAEVDQYGKQFVSVS